MKLGNEWRRGAIFLPVAYINCACGSLHLCLHVASIQYIKATSEESR